MTSQTYISALEKRHEDLDRKIEQELRHPSSDPLLVSSLKRKKLEVKDQMSQAQAMLTASFKPSPDH